MAKRVMESVAEAEYLARKRLPKSVYKSLIAGTEAAATTVDNTAAFKEVELAPIVIGQPSTLNTTVTVMGQTLPFPVLISPTGVQAVHPAGEVAIARAAKSRGTLMSLSTFSAKPLEEVGAVAPFLFQLYWVGSRDEVAARIERARAAGAVGLILTTDFSFSMMRDSGSPATPESLTFGSALRFGPEAVCRPRWLARYLIKGTLPDLKAPNLRHADGTIPTFLAGMTEWQASNHPTWEDVSWAREYWGGPFMLKGVTRVDDALRAVDAGCSAISVSNHGGNNLDTTPATLRCLPPIAEAINGQIEVLLDGGIRRGSDIAKAIALGADAVMTGRATLWGLAAKGQQGVEEVLDLLRAGLETTMCGLNASSLAELTPDRLHVPDGFNRALGVLAPLNSV